MNFSRQNLIRSAGRLVIALAISIVLIQFDFDYLEAVLYDIRIRFQPSASLSNKIEST
jgi:hypothetical protein